MASEFSSEAITYLNCSKLKIKSKPFMFNNFMPRKNKAE